MRIADGIIGSDRSLKPRERVLTALAHKEPDRVPIDLGGTVASGIHVLAHERLTKSMGLPWKGTTTIDMIQQLASPAEELLCNFGSDFRTVSMKLPKAREIREYTSDSGRPCFVDEWGVKWGKNPYYYDMIDHPLKKATTKALEEYPWPDPHAPGRTEGLKQEVDHLHKHTDFAIVAGMSGPFATGGLFEEAWWLRGFENFLADLIVRREFAEALLDKILEVHIDIYEKYLDVVGEHAQVIEWGDDYGMQTAPLVSPTMFRKYFKPRIKRFFDLVKSKTDAKIFLHSCGCVYPIIEDLIQSGVDILNPIQPLAAEMDHARLKREFGGKLCFHGGLDIQQLLPRGTPSDVREGVRKLLMTMAPGGGYIFAAAHNIQADVPPANIQAMYDAAKKFGTYPLKDRDD